MLKGISFYLLFASENIFFWSNELGRYSLVFLTVFSDKHSIFYERNAVQDYLKLKLPNFTSSIFLQSRIILSQSHFILKFIILLSQEFSPKFVETPNQDGNLDCFQEFMHMGTRDLKLSVGFNLSL